VRPRTAHCDRSSSAVLRARSCDDVKDGRPRAGGVGAVSAAVLDRRSELGRTLDELQLPSDLHEDVWSRQRGVLRVAGGIVGAGQRSGHANSN
jgi:hypothetical protein